MIATYCKWPQKIGNSCPCSALQRLAAPCRLKKEAKKRSKAAAGETAEAAVAGATSGAEGVPGDGEGATVPPQPVPNDPLNPLNAAYDMRAYALLRKLRLDEEHQISQVQFGSKQIQTDPKSVWNNFDWILMAVFLK